MPTTTNGLPYPTLADAPNLPAAVQALAEAVDTDVLDGWQTYAPAWTASTPPNIGNGTISGRYRQVGKTVHFWVQITMGSSTTYGAGQWRLSLPVAPRTGIGRIRFNCDYLDTGSASYFWASPWDATSSTITLAAAPTSAAGAGDRSTSSTVPHTWANTDILVVTGTYEAA